MSGSPAPIRAVAIFEASKGVLVVLAGLGVLSWHRGLQRVVDVIIGHLHLNPAKHHPHVFEVVASNASGHMVLLTVGAATYVLGRFVEAFGLWTGQRWAVWVAASTAAIYLPFELVELARHPGIVPIAALAINLGIVIYLLRQPQRPASGSEGARTPLAQRVQGDWPGNRAVSNPAPPSASS